METQTIETPRGVTARALLLGLLLIPLNTYWVTIVEVQWYALDGTSLPLFITPIFLLFVLCLLNLAIRKISHPLAFSRGELTVVYVMLVVSCSLAGHDMIQNLFGAIGHPFYFASPENEYQRLFFQYLPKFLLVTEPEALEAFYNGHTNPWTSGLWRYWVLPLGMWTIFLLVLFAMMLATNVILRRAWTQNEKLVFPLIQLPNALAGTAEGGGILKIKMLWYGFAVAAGITFINGMHVLYPQMPYLTAVKQYPIHDMFQTSPWNAIGHTNISMYPFAIGIAYFIPLDLSFSCWFFFVLRKLFQVLGRIQGWDGAANVGFPYFGEQAAGAWIGLGLVTILAARKYLANVWAQAMQMAQEEEEGEARDYRIALATIGLGVIFLAGWSVLLNLQWWVAILFFGIYLLLSLTITRVRAELGTPHEIFFVNPHNILINLFGTQAISPHSLAGIATMYWFNRGMRCHPMPNMMESFKMGEGARVHYRQMIFVLGLSLVFGLAVTFWANLQITYELGASARAMGFKWWLGTESYNDRLANWMLNPRDPNSTGILYMIGGFFVVLGLKFIRAGAVDFPLHPAGYALATSFAMDYFWFAFFISWLIKALITRYGGMRVHNMMIPFFLGLILGDFVMGSLWGIFGPIMGIQSYRVFI